MCDAPLCVKTKDINSTALVCVCSVCFFYVAELWILTSVCSAVEFTSFSENHAFSLLLLMHHSWEFKISVRPEKKTLFE